MDYDALKAAVARDLRDPDSLTFTESDLEDIIEASRVEVSRVAPFQFREDIDPVDDQLDYIVQEDVLGGASAELEIMRVEIWDGTTTPSRLLYRLQPRSQERLNTSGAGWELWGGTLSLTNGTEEFLVPDKHFLRVWGYRPYPVLVDGTDETGMTPELETALRQYARVQALERLNASRELYSQWQTRSGNSDISPAGLMNALTIALDTWRRTSSRITVIRQAP